MVHFEMLKKAFVYCSIVKRGDREPYSIIFDKAPKFMSIVGHGGYGIMPGGHSWLGTTCTFGLCQI